MEIRTKFMPGDSVWIMEANKPTQKTITCIKSVAYFDDENRFVISVHYSFDREHAFLTPEQNVAGTKEELKQIIFG